MAGMMCSQAVLQSQGMAQIIEHPTIHRHVLKTVNGDHVSVLAQCVAYATHGPVGIVLLCVDASILHHKICMMVGV